MREVFLYGCEGCGTIQYEIGDHGDNWCEFCQVCKVCQFHRKVVITPKYDMLANYVGSCFAIEEMKKDDTENNRK